MTVSGPVFVDTNILVYFRDQNDMRKNAIAGDWLRRLTEERSGRISTQVLIEFYAVATRGEADVDVVNAARADVEAFAAWKPTQPSIELMRKAWDLADRYALSWWDAMIVAAAQMSNCSTLLSEDMQHGLIVDQRLTIIDPFLA